MLLMMLIAARSYYALVLDRLLSLYLSRGISPWTARPCGAAHDTVGVVDVDDDDFDTAHLHACVLWHWREPLVRLLLNNGWRIATAVAAAAAADARDANAAAVARLVLMKNRGWWLRLRMHMLLR